jgi:hypothetical protein
MPLIDIEEFKYRAFCEVFELQVRQLLVEAPNLNVFSYVHGTLDERMMREKYMVVRRRRLVFPGNQITHPVHIGYAYFKKRPGLYYVVFHSRRLQATLRLANFPHVLYYNGNTSLSI